MNYRVMFFLFFCFALSACTSKNDLIIEKIESANLLQDSVFPTYQQYEIETTEQIYALDQSMKGFVHGHLIKEVDPYVRSKKLIKKLFNQSSESLRYQNGANLTAIEAFHENSANCLSLTILAYVLANEANLSVEFQQVEIPEYWIRNGDFNMLTGHVNIKVTGDKVSPYKVVWGNSNITVDFDPYSTKKHFSKRTISKDRVTAMFYNNKGAHAIVDGEYDLAYAYFKAAINKDNSFSAVWGNIGLLYKKMGLYELAEQSYLASVHADDENYNAWNNLSILLKQQDRFSQAHDIDKFLIKVRQTNPFYHGLLGDEAYFNGNYQLAIKHFNKAKKLGPKEHEFYFGLARTYLKLGNYDKSEYYLSKAKQHADFKDIQDKYQSKLNLLSRL